MCCALCFAYCVHWMSCVCFSVCIVRSLPCVVYVVLHELFRSVGIAQPPWHCTVDIVLTSQKASSCRSRTCTSTPGTMPRSGRPASAMRLRKARAPRAAHRPRATVIYAHITRLACPPPPPIEVSPRRIVSAACDMKRFSLHFASRQPVWPARLRLAARAAARCL